MKFKFEEFLKHVMLVGSEMCISFSLLYLVDSFDKVPFMLLMSMLLCCAINVLVTKFMKPTWKYISITNLFFIGFEVFLKLVTAGGSLKEDLISILAILLFVNLPIILSQSMFYLTKRIELAQGDIKKSSC